MLWLILIAAIVALAAVSYRASGRRRRGMTGRADCVLGVIVLAGFGFCAWSYILEHQEKTDETSRETLALAIAFDLSPSMLAIPDPGLASDPESPRHVRATTVLLRFLETLEQRGEEVFVSLSGFTKEAQVLMGWDRSTAQVREVMERALTPELFTTSGTSIEAATVSLTDLFDMLPANLANSSRRIAIIVSDGEDTMPPWSMPYAISGIESADFSVVALQAGSLDVAEGVPVYDELGEFRGFQVMGGKQHTTPDMAVMAALADASSERGIHLRAEDPASVGKLLQFSGYSLSDRAVPDQRLGAMLGMFAVVGLLCVKFLR